MLARLRQLAPMVEPHPTEIVVREHDAARVAEALVSGERLFGERDRRGWLTREVHGPAQVIERDRDGALVPRLTEELLRLLEDQRRVDRGALHVSHHPVRQEEPRARLPVVRGTGCTEHAIDAIPALGEKPPNPEADERLGHPGGCLDMASIEGIVQRGAKVVVLTLESLEPRSLLG